MKTSNLKYIFLAAGVALGVTAVSVYSCEKQNFVPNTDDAVSAYEDPTKFITEPGAICGEMEEKYLINDQGKTIGQAIVYNDTKYFYVIATPSRGFLLDKAYMNVTDLVDEMPLDANGNVMLSKFEYKIESRPASTVRKFRIPLDQMRAESVISVAIDVVSSRAEARPHRLYTAWIDGRELGNEGRMFAYTRQNCLTDDAVSEDATKMKGVPGDVCGQIKTSVILRQDDREVGKARIWNDTKYFYVELYPYKNYLLGNAFMEVCDNTSDIPVDHGGNPQTSKYEYNITSRPYSAERIFRIPLSDIETKSYVSVAVSMIQNSADKTREFVAWIDGRFIGNQKNGRLFSYTKQNCLTVDGQTDSAVK